jgi:sterol desaturase/sphingolipid hydroxylase (fatty acid hydroxylase superfamily)
MCFSARVLSGSAFPVPFSEMQIKLPDEFPGRSSILNIGAIVFGAVVSIFGIGFLVLYGVISFAPQPEKYGLSGPRALLFRLTNLILGVCMFYGSGLPLLFGSALARLSQQLELGQSFDGAVLAVLFPEVCASAPAVPLNCLGADHMSQQLILQEFGLGYTFKKAFTFVVVSILTEIIITRVVVPESHRPRDTYSFADTVTSMLMFTLYGLGSSLAIGGYVQPVYEHIHGSLYFFSSSMLPKPPHFVDDPSSIDDSLVFFFFAWLSSDLFYYLVHRWCHVTSWMWTDHAVHHSTEEFNMTAGPREGFFDWLTPYYAVLSLPLAVLFSPLMGPVTVALISLYPVSVHVVLFPPAADVKKNNPEGSRVVSYLSYFINNSSLHRIHHCRNHDRLGRNFGSFLSIWDRILGTWEPELITEDDKRDDIWYGVVPVLEPRWGGPLWSNTFAWYHMIFVVPSDPAYAPNSLWESMTSHWTPQNGRCPKITEKSVLNPGNKVGEIDRAGSDNAINDEESVPAPETYPLLKYTFGIKIAKWYLIVQTLFILYLMISSLSAQRGIDVVVTSDKFTFVPLAKNASFWVPVLLFFAWSGQSVSEILHFVVDIPQSANGKRPRGAADPSVSRAKAIFVSELLRAPFAWAYFKYVI